jgi:hypothetical protein
MALLRMKKAFFSNVAVSGGPITLDLAAGERVALDFATPVEATIVALLAAGIAKASTGSVLIGDYDPRVQSVHCKRIAGFVAHEPVALDPAAFPHYVAYRAALWNIDARWAQAHAQQLRTRLEGIHEAFAYPLIGALIGMPQLLVIDRPQAAYARQILDVAGDLALLSTHAHPAAAGAFA